MVTHLTLMRHGQTLWNATGRMQGHAPVPLDETGRQQAHLAADYLVNAGIDLIYSSDLKRAHETAQIVAERLGIAIKFDPRLREFDLGVWQGLTSDEIATWDGDTLAAFRADPYHFQRPGGESFAQVVQRSGEAINTYIQEHPRMRLLLVTHGGTIRSIFEALGFPHSHLKGVENTSFTQIQFDATNGGWRLLAVGETPHLSNLFYRPSRA